MPDEDSSSGPELRRELETLRAERDELSGRLQKIADLLKSSDPDRVLHDLRNVLNELQLYKLLAETDEA